MTSLPWGRTASKAPTTSPTGQWKKPQPAPRSEGPRAGFTLVELILVVVVSLLTVSMALPAFSLASRSTRLRAAARTVVAAHRYARGMAVLRQADMVLLLDERSGRFQVVQVEQVSVDTNATTHTGSPYARREAEFYLSTASSSTFVPTNTISAELTRDLPRDIRFEEIHADPMQRHESTWWIDYLPNGMCDPFEVVLGDGRGRRMVVRVDGLTGRAEVLEGER